MNQKPSEILADPANWTQGEANYTKNTGPCCMMGAVNRSLGGYSCVASTDGQAFQVIRERIQKHLGVRSILTWHDAPERTHAEVIAALVACGL